MKRILWIIQSLIDHARTANGLDALAARALSARIQDVSDRLNRVERLAVALAQSQDQRGSILVDLSNRQGAN